MSLKIFKQVSDTTDNVKSLTKKGSSKTLENDYSSDTIESRETLGYINGYSEYTSKSGVRYANWKPLYNKKVSRSESDDIGKNNMNDMGILYFDKHTPKFKKVLVVNDDIDDPLYIGADFQILTDSPLFKNVSDFFNNYSEYIPEIKERVSLYDEFKSCLNKIFPFDSSDSNSNKQHYVEAVSGLDNLIKKRINYPEDKITFTINEDLTMFTQYFIDLYNNLTFSYDTQRELIPSNLLRFDMVIAIKDFRNFKKYDENSQIKTYFSDDISSLIYIIHDCQFDFYNSKTFGDELSLGGLGGSKNDTPAKTAITMNFKSYSKITLPLLYNPSSVIDFRERFTETYTDTGYDVLSKLNKNYNYNNTLSLYQYEKKSNKNNTSSKLLNKVRTMINKEITESRNVLINELNNQITEIVSELENRLGGNLGFTLSKTNVYYDTIENKVDKLSFGLENFVNNLLDDVTGTETKSTKIKSGGGRTGSLYEKSNFERDYEKIEPRTTESQYNQKLPSGDLMTDGQYNQKFPDGDLMADGQYNQKFPDGSRMGSGQYNQKFPDGDLMADGQYNQKFPDGDLMADGQYNQKFPDGRLMTDGQYNQKFPDGDLMADGQYNQKFPDGDLMADGQYNQKFPDGRLMTDGQYNQKLPSGDLMNDGQYNQKFPDGDLMADGQYNQKFPDGSRMSSGQYNQKFPSGDLMGDGQYNQKFPDGTVNNDTREIKTPTLGNIYDNIGSQYNQKFPTGDRMGDGQYNQKYPDGNLYNTDGRTPQTPDGNVYDTQGQYNQKFPSGDLINDGQYNQKFPDGTRYEQVKNIDEKESLGSVYPKKTFRNKQPNGSVYNSDREGGIS